ncbi:MAG: glycosyltransferase family 2 protein [Nigerium sp.]|nr:glycosyltransferase family 2 protein [Nigerium sp.]
MIVPVYNCGPFLTDCLQSLFDQSYANLEIVAVDDGSEDDSGSILDAFAKVDSRLRVLHTPNRGLQLAWLAGLRASTGEYIGFVDGDDWVHPQMFQTLMEAALASGAAMVQCGYIQVANGRGSEGGDAPLSGEGVRLYAGGGLRQAASSVE